ncbi:hypothetical protein Barb7_02942 [Bacteroidales bacterium Barb7]|nr:hypothetical protein Barb7_02942 [Bacteroidales bacterium Barb7]
MRPCSPIGGDMVGIEKNNDAVCCMVTRIIDMIYRLFYAGTGIADVVFYNVLRIIPIQCSFFVIYSAATSRSDTGAIVNSLIPVYVGT